MKQLGAIATGHEASARAGAQALAEGGNAVDAAVAAAFAACMCEPTLTGIGGAGFATVHLPNGEGYNIDFFAAKPGMGERKELAGKLVPVDVLFGSTTQTFHVGPKSCAVPGFTQGVLKMHSRFGTMPLNRVLEPAIELCRKGLELPPRQAYCHHLLTPILTRTNRGREVFAPRGPMLVAGDHFEQNDLGATLELIASEGAKAIYHGDLAREIVKWSEDHGGLITRADLENYEAVERVPARGSWRNFELLTAPQPSSGGALISFALTVLERANGGVNGARIDVNTPEGAALLVAAMIASNGVRGSEFDKWLYSTGLNEWLASDEVIKRGDEMVSNALDASWVSSVSSRLGSTTHLSVIDANGASVSMTTSTGCGSGEFVGSTGIHLNNMMGEEDLIPVEHVLKPGDRLTSMMAPSIVLYEGRPVLATGSAGSNRMRGAILQTLLRVLELNDLLDVKNGNSDDRSLQKKLNDAVQTARLHAEDGIVHVEPGYAKEAVDYLRDLGHKLEIWPATNMYFGGANMVACDTGKNFAAAGDHRRGGGAFLAFSDGSVKIA